MQSAKVYKSRLWYIKPTLNAPVDKVVLGGIVLRTVATCEEVAYRREQER